MASMIIFFQDIQSKDIYFQEIQSSIIYFQKKHDPPLGIEWEVPNVPTQSAFLRTAFSIEKYTKTMA